MNFKNYLNEAEESIPRDEIIDLIKKDCKPLITLMKRNGIDNTFVRGMFPNN
jgi:hypothetical protein